MAQHHSTPQSLVDKIQRTMSLNEEDRLAVAALPWRTQRLQRGATIVSRGDRPTNCFLVHSGFVIASKHIANGVEAVSGLFVPGDMPDLFGLYLDVMDTDMRAATDCTIALVDHGAVKRVCSQYPKLNAAFWQQTLLASAILREWVITVGHRSAHARLAHLFCEVMVRMTEVGLSSDFRCPFPFTQVAISEISGMSIVHVNRSLQELRGAGLISFDGKELEIRNWDGLKLVADFQDDYLHLSR